MTTLLAVDDSLTMRKVLEITFAGEPFETVLASSTQEALDRLRDSQAQIALIDITLGGDSGYELCQKIKADAPRTRVVLLSSKQNPYDAARGAAAGADDHLDKPFDTQALIDKVTGLAEGPSLPPPKPKTVSSIAPAAHVATPSPPADPGYTEPVPLVEPVRSSRPPEQQPAAASSEVRTTGAPATSTRTIPRHTPLPDGGPADSIPPIVSQPPARPSAPSPNVPAASTTNGASFESKLSGLGLTTEQLDGVLALTKEVVEQAVWEVVPTLAETLIREEIQRLTKE